MKSFVWGGFGIGSTIGAYLPYLWDSSIFSFSSIILSAVGGMVGILVGYKMGQGVGM